MRGTRWQFSDTPTKLGISPEFGERNEAVLGELGELGYSAAEIGEFRKRGIS
ncbi:MULTISPECIES: hypothetical protein [Bradyrhizobium]|uniref:hypothetical protein n=1 Tax=Bradyrhizobium centrosematis TaxID=1300039 RepID=UPI002168A58C|nr:hypothetical protein [Bradyrhizobium centrosematis]MCS3765624.1 crotonobetainyl-CoA:carnitine CoA-transferase CaiB-like acyl-CoA transferase [Bradyrhizobium centrosematis]MCS3778158.1 crotonobetainyl-CoA:carnitine CoA-transferase CaiB-like acyl-CoA transferase [Bradyrhizobium centrosematis]